MESKLNYSAIEAYAKAYTTKFCDGLFSSSEKISGDDILNFDLKQTAMFVLRDIYTTWATEAENLKSPYFNYENEAVQSGLKKLMNILSKNILVNRQDIEPLISTAVYNTILLAISPYTYFKQLLVDNASSFEEVSELTKFIVINKKVVEAIKDKFEAAGDNDITATTILDNVFTEIEGPDSAEEIFEKLNLTAPIKQSDFYISFPVEDDEDDEDVVVSRSGETTINDRFSPSSYETLADQLKQNHIEVGSLKSMLSINQKFMFINDLFNDNQEDFNKVLDFLEGCETKDVAIAFINNNYLKRNIWNPNAPQVKEFIALLDKKFN